MPRITVEKFVAGELEHRFGVPAFALDIAIELLPESALAELAQHGVDIRALRSAHRMGAAYSASVEVTEGGVRKTIRLSVA